MPFENSTPPDLPSAMASALPETEHTPPGRATVRTVARLAGVSITTVSRVLNGKAPGIRSTTRERVFAVARQLDYRPSSLAVGLRKKTTRTIGLIIPDISDAYFHLLARGVEDTAQAAGYVVIFCNTDRICEREAMCVDMLCDKQVDAIIFAGGGVDDDRHLVDRNWGSSKVITLGPHKLPFPSIGFDNSSAMAVAVSHLAQRGCRRIAAIGGESNWLIHQDRMRGYERGLSEAGMRVDPALVWDGRFTIEAGKEAVRRALAAGVEFDGIVAFNDYSALGALQSLKQHGIAVPHDVAVVGCDDIPIAALVDPSLTSIAFPLYQIGVAASRAVFDLLGGTRIDRRTVVPFELQIRQSTMPTPNACTQQ